MGALRPGARSRWLYDRIRARPAREKRTARLVDYRDGVDLDKAARVGGEADDLDGRCRRLGVFEIFGPDAVERVLICEVGDEAIGGDDIGEARADRFEATF